MGEPTAAHSKPKLWSKVTDLRVHSGSDVLVGCSTGVISEGLEGELLISHQ